MIMTPEEFRNCYKELGCVTEVIIANVIVGNFSWLDAIHIADGLMRKCGFGEYAKNVVS